MKRIRSSSAGCLLLALLFSVEIARAQTTTFTYQGKLTDAGNPASGNYDLQFKLFDAVSGGTQQGTTLTNATVVVNAGVFNVTLDFGANVFSGAVRFLEIGVRPAGSLNAYTVLTPRQPITSTPYAIQSLKATNATTAINFSGALTGDVTGTQTATTLANNAVTTAKLADGSVTNAKIADVAGSKITGAVPVAAVPAGSANYIQNGTTPQTNANFNITDNGIIGGNLLVNGAVGIGTNAPTATLDVNGVVQSSQGLNTGEFRIGGSTVLAAQGSLLSLNDGGFSSVSIPFGKVGIGTSAPSGNLHIKGVNPVRILGDTTTLSGNESVDFFAHSSLFNSDLGGMRVQRQINFSPGNVDTIFYAAKNGNPATEVMRVAGNGNVGIGGIPGEAKLVVVSTTFADSIVGQSQVVGGNALQGWAFQSGGTGIFGKGTGGARAGYFSGNVEIVGTLSKSAGSFKIDHPLDPENKYLSHSFVESPDMLNVYNGVTTLDERGAAEIVLPAYFEALNKDYRYQLTCIGGFAPVYIASEVSGNRFRIAGGTPGLKVSWQVTGVRQDAYAKQHRIPVEEDKPEKERGTYLTPEVFGQSEEKGIEWARHPELMKRTKEERLNREAETKPGDPGQSNPDKP